MCLEVLYTLLLKSALISCIVVDETILNIKWKITRRMVSLNIRLFHFFEFNLTTVRNKETQYHHHESVVFLARQSLTFIYKANFAE
jgi:hypothetical protein